ncbi:MAG: hypothetical protein AUI16_08250 [Alphaproteobacteria bacterium 13_2_20CM_2_64_7]|nr:MAG: hypothetical protein AUI16_08250 [Alphaproteobacteria bacterium 13_2_20CM_2_64_7]
MALAKLWRKSCRRKFVILAVFSKSGQSYLTESYVMPGNTATSSGAASRILRSIESAGGFSTTI